MWRARLAREVRINMIRNISRLAANEHMFRETRLLLVNSLTRNLFIGSGVLDHRSSIDVGYIALNGRFCLWFAFRSCYDLWFSKCCGILFCRERA